MIGDNTQTWVYSEIQMGLLWNTDGSPTIIDKQTSQGWIGYSLSLSLPLPLPLSLSLSTNPGG